MAEKVVDAFVQTIIDQSLSQQVTKPGETVVPRVARSFRSLQQRRRTAEPLNINLAAAEHYMYARFLAGTSGDPSVKLAPTLYDLKKRFYFALGIEEKMATTQNPVLPPNGDVERWGTKGAADGLMDYTNATGRPATNYGKALSALVTEARRYN